MSSNLQNKLYNYEANPPTATWKKIAVALDDIEQANSFPSKLYNLEETPPDSAWGKIEVSLEEGHKTILPVPGKLSNLFRYAAAVVITGIIVFGGFRLLNDGSDKKEVAGIKNNLPAKDSVLPEKNEITASINNKTAETDEQRDDAALEASKHILAKNDIPSQKKLNLIREDNLSVPAHFINDIANSEDDYRELHFSEILQPSLVNNETTNDLADRYITTKTPDGNFIRISKKWADLACSVSGEEQDADCKDQLQKWREKIACSPLAPSSGNFMDILNLVSSLQTNND